MKTDDMLFLYFIALTVAWCIYQDLWYMAAFCALAFLVSLAAAITRAAAGRSKARTASINLMADPEAAL